MKMDLPNQVAPDLSVEAEEIHCRCDDGGGVVVKTSSAVVGSDWKIISLVDALAE
jgi:hypothetical protein